MTAKILELTSIFLQYQFFIKNEKNKIFKKLLTDSFLELCLLYIWSLEDFIKIKYHQNIKWKNKSYPVCGGSGSESIIKYFLIKNIELTLIVNACDDGKSTGQLRKIIPDLLGPSDFRKNFSYLINVF